MNGSSRHLFGRVFASLSLLPLFIGAPCLAQSQSQIATGAVAGLVRDESGGALPGATVEAVNRDTGFQRSAVSDRTGRYAIGLLTPGVYSVKAELPGFAPLERRGVLVQLGDTTSVDFPLPLSSVKEQVVVTGEAPIVETTSAAVAENVNERSIKTLPLNGRNFTDLVVLTPQTVSTSDNRVHVGGERGIMNSFNIDGADSNSSFFGEQRGGTRPPFTFSQEAIQEFQVISSSYNAQYGNAAGGIINAITKSGTNAYHGSAFYYFRNASLIQKDANGNSSKDFTQHQFGGTLGGPLIQDRLHFFVGFDGQRYTQPTFRSFIDPCQNNPKSTDCIAFSDPANQAKLKAYGEDLNADYGTLDQTNNENVPLIKFDWQASSSHLVTLRDNFSDEKGENLTSDFTTDAKSVNGLEKNRFNSLVGSVASVFGARTANELILQWAKEDRPREANSTLLPETVIGSNFQANFGQNNFLPNFLTEKRYQVTDNVSYDAGAGHTLRAGADVSRVDYNDGFYRYANGQYNYNGWADFFAGRPSRFQQSFSAFNGAVDYTTWFYNAYLQDTWKPLPNLTIDAGVRYEYQRNPNSEDSVPLFPAAQTLPSDTNNWAPRLGFAWDPANDHKSVVRGGFGIFYTNTPSLLIANSLLTNGVRVVKYDIFPIKTSPYTPNPNMPVYPALISDPSKLTATKPSLNAMDRGFQNPETYRGSIGYEREILKDFSVAIDGVLAYTKDLERQGDTNLTPVGTTADGRTKYSTNSRPNSNFGQIQTFISDSVAHYEAVVLSIRKRFSSGWQMMGSYTWSKANDDNSNERNVSFGSSSPEDFFDVHADYGPADFDVRHRLVVSSTWELPWGFVLSGIFQYRTGFPYSALAGFDVNGDGNSATDRANVSFDANGNPSGAHFGRNTFRQPDYKNLDLAIQKTFRIFGNLDATLIAQGFNVAHSSNRRTSNTTYYVTSGGKITSLNGNFGVPTSVGSPRQFQLGARLAF